MAYELRDGGGTIFKNKFKKDGDNAPSYRGEIQWRGERLEIALWVKDGRDNSKFFSVKVQEPREKQEAKPVAQQPKQSVRADMDDEIPFAPETRG